MKENKKRPWKKVSNHLLRDIGFKNKSIFYNLICITMTNINRDTLLKEFTDTTNVIWRHLPYISINNHYNKDCDNYGEKEIVQNFIEDQLFYLTNEWKMDYDDINYWIGEIERFEVSEHADSSVDIYDDDLMEYYKTFENWTELDVNNGLTILETMKQWQFDWYYELYSSIKEEFNVFLNEKQGKRTKMCAIKALFYS